jgi:hypothetical protein
VKFLVRVSQKCFSAGVVGTDEVGGNDGNEGADGTVGSQSLAISFALHIALCLYILVRHLNTLLQDWQTCVLETGNGCSEVETHLIICLFLVK